MFLKNKIYVRIMPPLESMSSVTRSEQPLFLSLNYLLKFVRFDSMNLVDVRDVVILIRLLFPRVEVCKVWTLSR